MPWLIALSAQPWLATTSEHGPRLQKSPLLRAFLCPQALHGNRSNPESLGKLSLPVLLKEGQKALSLALVGFEC